MLVAIPAPAAYPIGSCVFRQTKLRELVDNIELAVVVLAWNFIAKSDAVVMYANTNTKKAIRAFS